MFYTHLVDQVTEILTIEEVSAIEEVATTVEGSGCTKTNSIAVRAYCEHSRSLILDLIFEIRLAVGR